ncbi:U32 family peptidase [Oscillospiraceae bacterium PP1C4]
MNMKHPIEVLAPAGSMQSLDAALACGADAVYLGTDVLNARRNAENFTKDNLAETVRRCHIRGVKVYLTLNIVVLENEIQQLLDTAKCACEAGVDAVIVQDLGAAAILRRCCPDLKLTASTQMAVHNSEGVKLLEDMGFSRVVLARECSKEEIKKIVQSTSLEVEVFVHGALCMCVSGQCYMSSVLGQRSGNRGLCAQPCRLGFESSEIGHALSLKDMSLIERISELREIGVTSIKIEGRMKRPEYVAAAVTACRTALAGEPVDMETLQAVFSRSGFTDGYFSGARGLNMFGIRAKEDVTAATGVLGQLANLYNEPKRHVQKVATDFSFVMQPNEPVTLTATDCDGNTVTVRGDLPQIAINKPTDAERAKANIEKTGGTPYRVNSVTCEIADGLMMPVSSLNALRREALEALDELRGAPRVKAFDADKAGTLLSCPHLKLPQLRIRLDRAEQLTPMLWEHADLIILPVPELVKLCATGAPKFVSKLCAGLPRMLFSGQEQLRERLELLRKNGITHASVGNLGALKIASEAGFILHGEPFFNAVNSHSVDALAKWRLSDLTLSFELNLDAVRRLNSPIPYGVTAYGYLPLMTVRNCPVQVSAGCEACKKGKNFITDRKGNQLHTTCAYGCSEILNPVPLYMADRLNELHHLDFIVLSFTTESARECEEIFRAYLNGEEFHGKFTRGLLYKTIL